MDNDTTNTQLKRCVRCGEAKPATPENFWRDKGRPDGFYHSCKPCCNAKKAECHDPTIRKTCMKCNTEYPATADYFYRDKTKLYGLGSHCKACHDKKLRTPGHKNWMRQNGRKKQLRVRSLPKTLTNGEWQNCLDYFNHRCAVCNRPAGLWHILVPDHWIPIASPDCPGTIATNIIPLCNSTKDGSGGCNSIKSDKNAEEWIHERFDRQKAKRIINRINSYFDCVRNLPDDK